MKSKYYLIGYLSLDKDNDYVGCGNITFEAKSGVKISKQPLMDYALKEQVDKRVCSIVIMSLCRLTKQEYDNF